MGYVLHIVQGGWYGEPTDAVTIQLLYACVSCDIRPNRCKLCKRLSRVNGPAVSMFRRCCVTSQSRLIVGVNCSQRWCHADELRLWVDVVNITGSKNTMAFTYDIGTNLRIPMRNIKTEEGSQHARFCEVAAS